MKNVTAYNFNTKLPLSVCIEVYRITNDVNQMMYSTGTTEFNNQIDKLIKHVQYSFNIESK